MKEEIIIRNWNITRLEELLKSNDKEDIELLKGNIELIKEDIKLLTDILALIEKKK